MIKRILFLLTICIFFYQKNYSNDSTIYAFKKNQTFIISAAKFHPYTYNYNFSYQYNIFNDLSFAITTGFLDGSVLESYDMYSGYQGKGIKIYPEFKYYTTSIKQFTIGRLYLSTGIFYRAAKIQSSSWETIDSTTTKFTNYKYASTKENEIGFIFRAGMEVFLDKQKRFFMDLSIGYSMGYLNKVNQGDNIYFSHFKAETDELMNLSGGYQLGFGYYLFPTKK